MKLISLNTWGGQKFEAMTRFLKDPANKAEIYCFQEMIKNDSGVSEKGGYRANLFEDVKQMLPGYKAYYYPFIDNWLPGVEVDFPIAFGQAMFVSRELEVITEGEEFIFKQPEGEEVDPQNGTRNLEYLELKIGEETLWVFNYHGITLPGDKTDTPQRLEQSKKIIEFIESRSGEKILCGDFNLDLNTESVRMIEDSGMINLIKKFEIKDTRGPINKEKYPDDPQNYADFTFISPGITVKSFQVPQLPISDHLPMILEF